MYETAEKLLLLESVAHMVQVEEAIRGIEWEIWDVLWISVRLLFVSFSPYDTTAAQRLVHSTPKLILRDA